MTLRIEQELPPGGFVPAAIGGGQVRLSASAGEVTEVLAAFDGRYWSYEVAKSFTGRVLGAYAVDGEVAFTAVRYRGTDEP